MNNATLSIIWTIFKFICAILAIIFAIFIAWKIYDHRRHNVIVELEVRRGNSTIPTRDRARIYRKDGKINFHLLKKKIEIKGIPFEDIKREELTGASVVHMVQLGADDFKVLRVDFEGIKYKPLQDDSRFWWIEKRKEAEKAFTLQKDWEKWIPTINFIIVGFIMIISLYVISNRLGDAASATSGANAKIADTLVVVSKNLVEASRINQQLSPQLGITTTNITPVQIPIG
jgi:hypothetical protein